MTTKNLFKYFKTSPDIIKLAVMYYVRFPLSLRQVEDILHQHGIDISREKVRSWWNRFGPILAKEVWLYRAGNHSNWRWYIDDIAARQRMIAYPRGSPSIQAAVLNQFGHQRHFLSLPNFKNLRDQSQIDWRILCVVY